MRKEGAAYRLNCDAYNERTPGLDVDVRRLEKPETLGQRERKAFRQLALRSLHFFTVFVLRYTRLGPVGGFHELACCGLETLTKPAMKVWWRGAFKSTICSIARPLWKLVNDPEGFDHVGVYSDLPLGIQHLRAIGDVVDSNFHFRYIFPEIEPRKEDWSATTRSITARSGGQGSGPSFEIRTTNQPMAGRHVQAVTLDDLTNDINWRSLTTQDVLKGYIDRLWPALDTDEFLAVATLYADYDTSHHLIRNLWPEELDVDVCPVRDFCVIDADGTVRHVEQDPPHVYHFAEEWNDERYERERRRVTDPFVWSSQYLLDCTERGNMGFDLAWIQYVERAALPELTHYIALDPASGRGTSHPALAVAGIDAEGRVYALYSSKAYRTEADLIEAACRAHQAYEAVAIGVEKYGQSGFSTLEMLERRGRELGVMLPLVPMTHGHSSKQSHILTVLRSMYQFGKMRHVGEMKGSSYEQELERFPGQTDDELDAMAYACRLCLEMGNRTKRGRERCAPVARGDKVGYTLRELAQRGLEEEQEEMPSRRWW